MCLEPVRECPDRTYPGDTFSDDRIGGGFWWEIPAPWIVRDGGPHGIGALIGPTQRTLAGADALVWLWRNLGIDRVHAVDVRRFSNQQIQTHPATKLPWGKAPHRPRG